MTEPKPSQIKREFLKSVWFQTKSASLVRECKEIYEKSKDGVFL